MIDRFLSRFLGTPDAPDTEEQEAEHPPIEEWDEELKWDIAQRAQYRCARCGTPEFRVEALYLVETRGKHEEDHIPACEDCLEEARRGDEADEKHRIPNPPLGRRGYLIDPDGATELRHRKHGPQELAATEETPDPDESDDMWMGEYPRKLVERKHSRPRAPLWIGYERRGKTFRDVGAEFKSLFRHVWINGTTGMGKSTLAYNLALQRMWSGHGLCVIDPHDDLVDDLIKAVPPHRREDVIIIDPSSAADSDRMVSINFLEVGPDKGDDGYHDAVDEQVELVTRVLRGGGAWGSRMGPIAENLTRAMILSEKKWTFLDMQEILVEEAERKRFAEQITSEGYDFISRYTRQIAEMGTDELDSLTRKLNPWAESFTARRLVGQEESSISWDEIVRDQSLVFMRNKVGRKTIKKLYATGVFRCLWRAAQRQPKGDRKPFTTLIDEAHEVLTGEMEMDTLLTGARKFRFNLILMSQYLGKVDDPAVREAIKEICNTFITLRVKGDGVGELASYYNVPPSNIRDLGEHQALVTIEVDGGPVGPIQTHLWPPYPPLRTADEAEEWIQGLSDAQYGAPLGVDTDSTERSTTADEEDDSDPLELTDRRKMLILKAILDETEQTGEDGAVHLNECWDRIMDYHPEGDAFAHASQKGALIDTIPEGEDGDIILTQDDSGDMWVSVTADGRRDIMATGTSASSGGPKHRKLLKDAYRPLTKLGGQVNLPLQNGDEMPDGSVRVDPARKDDDDFDIIEELTGGVEAALEAESSTGDSKGGQTAQNVAETTEGSQRCLLLSREHNAEKIWKTLMKKPFVHENSDIENGEERLYNLGNLHISGETMLRPAIEGLSNPQDQTIWIHDLETDEYVLRDAEGTEHHRFGNPKAVFEDVGAYPETVFSSSDTPDGWKTVKKPFIPERAFSDGLPARDEWEIVIVPDGATDPHELAIYRDGEKYPLSKDERNPLWESDIDEHDDAGARTQTDATEDKSGLFDDALGQIDDLPDFD